MKFLSASTTNVSSLLHSKLIWVAVAAVVIFYGYRKGWFQGNRKWLIIAVLAIGGWLAYKHGYLNKYIHSTGGGGGSGG